MRNTIKLSELPKVIIPLRNGQIVFLFNFFITFVPETK
jgi:hypothetical protein